MTGLEGTLRGLIHHLTANGFTRIEDADVRKFAIDAADSVGPPQLFLAWLQRCPEAREFLDSRGLPSPPTPERPVTIDAGSKRTVRVLYQGQYHDVEVVGRAGGMYRFQSITDRYLLFAAPIAAVHNDDRHRAQAIADAVCSSVDAGESAIDMEQLRRDIADPTGTP
jgi:hypothetical protein